MLMIGNLNLLLDNRKNWNLWYTPVTRPHPSRNLSSLNCGQASFRKQTVEINDKIPDVTKLSKVCGFKQLDIKLEIFFGFDDVTVNELEHVTEAPTDSSASIIK